MTQFTRSSTPLRVAVRGVDHQHVDAGLDQRLDALFGALADADRRADAQLALLVLAGVRVLGCLEDVLDRDQAAQLAVAVDHQHALEAVLVHQRLALRSRLAPSLTVTSRSCGVMMSAHRLVELRLEAQVAVGDDADHLACPRPPGKPEILCCRCSAITSRTVMSGAMVIGSRSTPALEALDLGDLGGLRLAATGSCG